MLFAFGLASSAVQAKDFLNDAQHMFFDSKAAEKRFGIEIEFGGVSDDAIVEIITEKLNAKEIERKPDGTIVFESAYGIVQLKIEGRAWRYEKNPEKYKKQLEEDLSKAPRELVFPPMHFADVDVIQSVADALKARGAIGTNSHHAVSTQVNVEMRKLFRRNAAVKNLLNLMRVYSRESHREQIDERLEVPEIRKKYIGDYSDGFLHKLMDEDYNPTARELFDDYFYRQGLEVIGDRQAWSISLPEAKRRLLARLAEDPDAIGPAVVKMQKLRVSSLLLHAFAADPISKIILATHWAKAIPIVEFREANTDFNVRGTIETALGIVRSAEVYGNYEHDVLVSRLTGIDARDLEVLRQYMPDASVVRYTLVDPKTLYFANQNKLHPSSVWIQLSPNQVGRKPLVLDGESIVFHRRHIHRKTILGKYNPGLENYLIQQVMENKLFEAKLFAQFAPSAMPRSRTLVELTSGKRANVPAMLERLKAEFPSGWVMKGAWDLSTERFFISDQLDIEQLLKDYKDGFERYRAKVEKENAGADPEYILEQLKKHPGYRGWKIHELLVRPDLVFFQERVAIRREFRVETIAGKVLGNGSTIDRYAYERKKKQKLKKPTAEEIERVEQFVQTLVDSLPEPMRVLPYGFDIALLEDGSMTVIESNPGGNSSFLEENARSQRALDHFLTQYPDMIKEGQLKLLAPHEQMKWILARFEEFGIVPRKHFPGMRFLNDDIEDSDYKTVPRVDRLCENLLVSH